jgi:hypothetical protein
MLSSPVVMPGSDGTIDSTEWSSSYTASTTSGSTTGTAGAMSVTYAGKVRLVSSFAAFFPASTFSADHRQRNHKLRLTSLARFDHFKA